MSNHKEWSTGTFFFSDSYVGFILQDARYALQQLIAEYVMVHYTQVQVRQLLYLRVCFRYQVYSRPTSGRVGGSPPVCVYTQSIVYLLLCLVCRKTTHRTRTLNYLKQVETRVRKPVKNGMVYDHRQVMWKYDLIIVTWLHLRRALSSNFYR